jgi:hypothetical protein
MGVGSVGSAAERGRDCSVAAAERGMDPNKPGLGILNRSFLLNNEGDFNG